MITPDQAKQNSHAFLREHDIRINEHLPVLEGADELRPQDAQSVARRCVVLSYVIGIAYGADPRKLYDFLKASDLIEHASSTEKDLLGRSNHTDQEKTDATWLTECVQSLAWCIGLVDLDPFRRCDDNLASHFPKPFVDPSEFIVGATLRPFDEIYQQADLHYRLHWAARDSRLNGTPCPVEEGMIMERRKPLDWTIGVEADWDEVPLDT